MRSLPQQMRGPGWSGLITASGGLVYHLRALLYRDKLWRPFASQLSMWLDAWQPQSQELVVIGPSGGYCLPLPWFGQFQRLHIVEPDPLARWIFSRRLRQSLVHAPEFVFINHEMPLRDIDALQRFFAAYAPLPLLFCNVLGQISLQHQQDKSASSAWTFALRANLAAANFFSFHDRCSFDGGGSNGTWSSTTGALACDEATRQALKLNHQNRQILVEVDDHGSDVYFKGLDSTRNYAVWQIRSNRTHIIESLAHHPPLR